MKIKARVVGHALPVPGPRLEPRALHLRDEDYADRTYVGFGPIGSQFDRCSFRNTRITNASLGSGQPQTIYRDCSFDGSRIDFSAAGHARLERCLITNVHWSSLASNRVEFVGCTFSGRFEHGYISARVPDRLRGTIGRSTNEIRGNDFHDAEFVDFELRGGVDLTTQHIAVPHGAVLVTEAAAALSALEILLDSLPSDVRPDARVVLDVLRYSVAHGQTQVIIDPRQYPPELAAAVEAVVEATRGLPGVTPRTEQD